MRSLSDLDVDQLSDEARTALSAVQRIVNRGEPQDEVLAELGMSEDDYQRANLLLAQEWTRQGGNTELPPLTSEEYAGLRDSISASGQHYPILRAPDGTIVDGKNRLRACRELGKEPWFRDVDGTKEELESLALVVNLARRHLTTGAKRGIVKSELLRDAGRSNLQIATMVGVSHPTVASVRAELEQDGSVEKTSTRVDAIGRVQPATKPPRERKPPAELPDGVIDVTLRIGKHVARDLDGGKWLDCKAVRLVLVDAGVYSLELQPA